MNSEYTINDTTGSDGSLINYAFVAFDTIFDYNNNIAYPSSDYNSITIDTIAFTAGWEANTINDDTIEVSVVEANAKGYPTEIIIWDTLLIYPLGSTLYNEWESTTTVVVSPNITVAGHFAVKLQYFGAKVDTFAFAAGYPENPYANCPNGYGAAKSSYYPNSYAYWVSQSQLFPTASGSDIFYNCDNNPSSTPDSTDGLNYIQNIDMTVTLTINDTCHLSVSESHTNTQCGQSNGSINLTVAGAVLPVSYKWSNGDTTQNLSTLGQGIYYVTVSDSTCAQTLTVTINNSNGPVITTTHNDITCTNLSGSINDSVSGGTPPYTFLWSNGATKQNIDSLHAGNYYLTVTDNTGCAGYAVVSVNYNVGNQLFVYVNGTTVNCNNAGGIISATAYSGTPPYAYQWNTGQSTSTVTGLVAGNYSVTATDSLGCAAVGYGVVYNQCANIVQGKVFDDVNGNCTYGAGDTPLPNVPVMAVDNFYDEYFGYTDSSGNYYIAIFGSGIYNISVQTPFSNVCGNITPCGNPSSTVTFGSVGDSSLNNNFGFTGGTGFDLTLHPGWSSANPGFAKQYWVMPYNQSPTPFNGTATITFNYDSHLIYDSSRAPLPTVIDTVNHILIWTTTYVPSPIYDWYNGRFVSNFTVRASTPLSYYLQSEFTIAPTSGDCDTSNNSFSYSDLVTGSHDPNEKDVFPTSIAYEDSILTYTIHFQNTGSDTTNFIIVKDTLSPYLDASSVINLASSNRYESFTVSGKGILTWQFTPIYLVDSAANPSASKGFIMFSVKKKKSVPPGTSIPNKASVYFDYNTPVVTNTAASYVDFPLGTKNISGNNSFAIFPNPSDGNVTVSLFGNETIQQVSITNTLGQMVSNTIISNGNNKTMQVQLPETSGMYFIHLKGTKGEYVGKVVKN